MRYIDIERVDRPDAWDDRAAAALDALCAEIATADNAAQAAGQNPREARRRAVSAGLDRPSRQRVWRDLGPAFARLGYNKCWYSETRNDGSDGNIDHFRPKASVAEDGTHEGYWWLAFDWRNFRYSSQWCNQRRNDPRNGTSGGKADRFPLQPDGTRAQRETDCRDRESPALLDPVDPEDWKLLTFSPNGQPTPAQPDGTSGYARVQMSIEVYHLHCHKMVQARKRLAGAVERVVEDMEMTRDRIADPVQLAHYKRRQRELLRLIDREAEYSAAALAYARSQILKHRCGRTTRREWLEEILNSNP